MSLMVIGAHAMDAEIMAGGLAAMQAAQGRRVVLLHLTRGERGHPTKPAAEFGRQLEAELAEAAAALGQRDSTPRAAGPAFAPRCAAARRPRRSSRWPTKSGPGRS